MSIGWLMNNFLAVSFCVPLILIYQSLHLKNAELLVAKMLKNEYKYISKKAYSFLIGQKIKDVEIIELLGAYKEEKL